MKMNSSLIFCVLLGTILTVRAQLSSTVPPLVNTSEPTTEAQTTPGPTTTPVTPYPTSNGSFTSESSTPATPTSPQPTSHGSPLLPSQIMCPPGWEFQQGRCYYFENNALTWPQALSNCALLESMLVSVHSIQEYAFLQQLTINNGNEYAWLGGFYLQDQWLWLDGSWFYNISWANEYPDSTSPCLELNSYEPWSNTLCNLGTIPSICVKNSNVPSEMVCPEGWTGFQGRCYYYNSGPLTWPEADANCAGLQASLVSVHSPEEYNFLYQHTSYSAWLGGFYLDGQWLWLDGSWFYQEFFSQTSNSSSQCLSTSSQDGWGSYDCDQALPSFCVSYMQ